MSELRHRHNNFYVRHALGCFWRRIIVHIRPVEGLPRMSAEQIQMLIDELRHRYIPALEAMRDRGFRVPQPREDHPPLSCMIHAEMKTPMTDALEALDLIADSKLPRPEDEEP